MAKGNTIGHGKLFLGEVYRYLHLMSSSLLSQKKLRTGGPWWFIQLWAHLYFQNHIPTSLFWPIIPSQIRVGDALDVPALAKLCTIQSTFLTQILKALKIQVPLDWMTLPMVKALSICTPS
jgi:hypothetical protein